MPLDETYMQPADTEGADAIAAVVTAGALTAAFVTNEPATAAGAAFAPSVSFALGELRKSMAPRR